MHTRSRREGVDSLKGAVAQRANVLQFEWAPQASGDISRAPVQLMSSPSGLQRSRGETCLLLGLLITTAARSLRIIDAILPTSWEAQEIDEASNVSDQNEAASLHSRNNRSAIAPYGANTKSHEDRARGHGCLDGEGREAA